MVTATRQTLKDVVNNEVKLSGNKDTKVKPIGLQDGEPMSE